MGLRVLLDVDGAGGDFGMGPMAALLFPDGSDVSDKMSAGIPPILRIVRSALGELGTPPKRNMAAALHPARPKHSHRSAALTALWLSRGVPTHQH